MLDLDEGESEAISLAKELKADFLFFDERAGTNVALEKGLTTIGLVGVLMKAKELGLIPKLAPILIQLKDHAGFWIGKRLLDSVLKEAGER